MPNKDEKKEIEKVRQIIELPLPELLYCSIEAPRLAHKFCIRWQYFEVVAGMKWY